MAQRFAFLLHWQRRPQGLNLSGVFFCRYDWGKNEGWHNFCANVGCVGIFYAN
jgi:hypothetical protein